MLLVDNQRHLHFSCSGLSSENYWLNICVISGNVYTFAAHFHAKRNHTGKHFNNINLKGIRNMTAISTEYKLLTLIESKMGILDICPCLLSLNGVCLSIAVDACRTTKYFKGLLSDWRQCLPLGEGCDVSFELWGHKIWEMIFMVQRVYRSESLDP